MPIKITTDLKPKPLLDMRLERHSNRPPQNM